MRKKITSDTWGEIKAGWLSGLYSFGQLAKQYSLSEATIKTRSCRERWKIERKKFDSKVMSIKEEKAVQRLSRLGYSLDEHFQRLVEGTRTASITMLYNKREYQIPDYRTRLEFQKELDRIMGLHAPLKQEERVVDRLEVEVIHSREALNLPEKEMERFDDSQSESLN